MEFHYAKQLKDKDDLFRLRALEAKRKKRKARENNSPA